MEKGFPTIFPIDYTAIHEKDAYKQAKPADFFTVYSCFSKDNPRAYTKKQSLSYTIY